VTDPKGTTFTGKGVVADFARFLLPPEAAYGAAGNLHVTMAGMALAAWTLLF
jgi:hypothetical protein